MKQCNNETILYLNTAGEETLVALFNRSGETKDEIRWPARFNQSEELLQKVEALLSKNHIEKCDLAGVIVKRGPGSYTGLRVGITTANFVAFSLNIPIIGVTDDKISSELISDAIGSGRFVSPVHPFYNRPPCITTPKS